MNFEKMQERNIFDTNIANQPEIEYRKAKPPFVIKHSTLLGEPLKEKIWYSMHCPVCFWNREYMLWDCLIDPDAQYCHRCGQKIDWSDSE